MLKIMQEKFKTNFMRRKLFNMLKKNGQYIRFNKENGFHYNLILESEDNCIQITVAFKDLSSLKILSAAVIDNETNISA
ncbi:hypothetical protein [Bacillus swezeyi]|nr:hypothetical protein [Bacillus swezeyi]